MQDLELSRQWKYSYSSVVNEKKILTSLLFCILSKAQRPYKNFLLLHFQNFLNTHNEGKLFKIQVFISISANKVTFFHSFSWTQKAIPFFIVTLCAFVCVSNWLPYVCFHLTLVNFYWLFNFLHTRTAVKTTIKPKYPKYWSFSVMISPCQTTLIKLYCNDLYWKMNIKRYTNFAGSFPIVFYLQIKSLTNQQTLVLDLGV